MIRRRSILAGLAVAALAATPSTAPAQEYGSMDGADEMRDPPVLDVHLEAGPAFPVGDFTDFVNPGIHAGVGVNWWLGDHVALRGLGGVDAMSGDDQGTTVLPALPDMRLFYLAGGVQFDVAGRSSDRPWSVQATTGVGSSMLDTETFFENRNNRPEDLTHTYPQVNAGIEIGYDLHENVKAQVGTKAFFTFVDETDLAPLYEMNPQAEASDLFWTMPITIALNVDLPS